MAFFFYDKYRLISMYRDHMGLADPTELLDTRRASIVLCNLLCIPKCGRKGLFIQKHAEESTVMAFNHK